MTDWQLLISQLLDAGLSRDDIVRLADSKPATINDLARGTTREPRHSLGERLRALHGKTVQHTRGKRGGTRKK